MASFEISGKLIEKYNTVQRTSTFRTREFVIEVSEEANGRTFYNYVKFQCVQDKTEILDRFNNNDILKVTFNIRGTKWEKDGKVNYITNLDAWRIESVQMSNNNGGGFPDAPTTFVPDNAPSNDVDDLPF
ncbi:MAG: hypothetical protein DI598_08030 [Pseudopedobacter saltans]|uniref:DUF3127 domain-containing protein n=1 Tax=Pseudopedobacter saltans TaxID=151895 RepID=A0A2W5F4Z3_9SPHI|nr:MAG: hypothetical protein DI598_08030 [Pseudopedobacter saltans]